MGEEEGERGSTLLRSGRRSRGGKEREEGLKKAPSMEGQAAMGQTRQLGSFLIKRLLEWAF